VGDAPHDSSDNRATVAQAAQLLGITEGAVRKRVERGKLTAERTPDGRLIVNLAAPAATDTTSATHDTTHDRPRQSRGDRYTRSLEDQVAYLRQQLDRRDEELREHRRLLAGLIERVPELEAPATQEATEAAETVEEASEGTEPRSYAPTAQEGVQRPWWRRIVGR
jgi:excisionase family DNA binding protein